MSSNNSSILEPEPVPVAEYTANNYAWHRLTLSLVIIWIVLMAGGNLALIAAIVS